MNRTPWLWLAAAAVLLVFANGRWVWAPAAWLAPMFLLLFLEARPRVSGLVIGFAVQLLAFFINWQGMIPVPGAWYYLVAGIYAFFYYLPFVVHRFVARRIAGFASTLALASAWVTIELIFQQWVTPYGSWASIAYTQVDQRWLLQLASLTGTAGISFVVLWSAAVLAWLWGRRAEFGSARRGLVVYASVMALVLAWGGYRLLSEQAPQATVQLAGIVPSQPLQNEVASVMGRVRSERQTDESTALANLVESAARLNNDILERTRIAADQGARLVVWSEHAARLIPQTEQAFLADAALVARDHGTAVVLGIGLWNPAAAPSFENKLTAIHPDGSIAWTYHKARPIAGSESGLLDAGSTAVETLDMDFGRVGVAICHDLDFPDFVRSAGRDGVDLLIGPSSDWSEIATMHHRMAAVRAVENGVTLFRPCEAGVSSVVDPFGRVRASVREEGQVPLSFAAEAPIYDVSTLYSLWGNGFAYANGVLIVAFVLLASRRRP